MTPIDQERCNMIDSKMKGMENKVFVVGGILLAATLAVKGIESLVSIAKHRESTKQLIYSAPYVTIPAEDSMDYSNQESFRKIFKNEKIEQCDLAWQYYVDEIYTINPGLGRLKYEAIKMIDPDRNGEVKENGIQ